MKEFTRAQIIAAFAVMVAMQESLNKMVVENWDEQGFTWHRAIWVEIGEWMEQVGWKWWKKQKPDAEQAKLEVVDIFHFVLSWCIENGREGQLMELLLGWIANDIFQGDLDKPFVEGSTKTPKMQLLAHTEHIVSELTKTRGGDDSYARDNLLPLPELIEWMALQISVEELYLQYVAKNTLNRFRQDNGYKEGTYKKIIDGVEDNVALAEIVKGIDFDKHEVGSVPLVIRAGLSAWYFSSQRQPV